MERDRMRYRIGVAPMQFSDGPKATQRDLNDLFELAEARNWASFMLTEIGPGTELDKQVRALVKSRNYRASYMRSNVVLVPRKRIKVGSWTAGNVFVEDTSTVEGPGHDSAFAWGGWWDLELDQQMYNAGLHYPTGWRENRNRDTNKRYAGLIDEWAIEKSINGAIVHASGDFNMPDQNEDLFFGGILKTAADEKKKWPNTGHGPIDGVGFVKGDKRIKVIDWRVADDKIFPQATDHFVDEAEFDYTPVKPAPTSHQCPKCGATHKIKVKQ